MNTNDEIFMHDTNEKRIMDINEKRFMCIYGYK